MIDPAGIARFAQPRADDDVDHAEVLLADIGGLLAVGCHPDAELEGGKELSYVHQRQAGEEHAYRR